MKTQAIGINAGKLWELLDQTDEITTEAAQERLSFTEEELYTAIGWLAREEKIYMRQKEGKKLLSNKRHPGVPFFG